MPMYKWVRKIVKCLILNWNGNFENIFCKIWLVHMCLTMWMNVLIWLRTFFIHLFRLKSILLRGFNPMNSRFKYLFPDQRKTIKKRRTAKKEFCKHKHNKRICMHSVHMNIFNKCFESSQNKMYSINIKDFYFCNIVVFFLFLFVLLKWNVRFIHTFFFVLLNTC